MQLSADQFVSIALQNPINKKLNSILRDLNLPQCTLTAGCLFQSAWNIKSGNAADWGIKDYDVFYFDDQNPSWEAEDKVITLINQASDSLGRKVEVRNQARVHLWYSQKFGRDYPQLMSSYDGIDRYLIACTRLGIDVRSGKLYAPDGLEDMWNGVLRMNPFNAQPDLFGKKCENYLERWPWLTIEQ